MHTWIVCTTCGAVIADPAVHAAWHGTPLSTSPEPIPIEEAPHA